MNFFQRRRILKNTSFLELVPLPVASFEILDNGLIDLKIPKFRNKGFAQWFIPKRKSLYITVHLDATGSRIWHAMDGKSNAGDILKIVFKEAAAERTDALAKFLSQLYDSGYISFAQIRTSKN